MELFVNRSERITVPVWAWEDKTDGKLVASPDVKDVPEGESSTKLEFVFRKPTYRDSNHILTAAEVKGENNVNAIAFGDAVIRTLLIEMRNGSETHQMTAQRLSDLQPALARAAVAGVLQQISI